MNHGQGRFLGLKQLPRELSGFEFDPTDRRSAVVVTWVFCVGCSYILTHSG